MEPVSRRTRAKVDPDRFRQVLSEFCSGIVVVTGWRGRIRSG
jgi:hypothetical protein